MLSTVASLAQIVSVIGAFIVGMWGIWRKIDKHQSNTDQRNALMEQRLDSIQAQFGPNGGGLREKVNTMSVILDKIDSKLDCVTSDVAKLTGEFHQHIRESKTRE
jgi:hypothetical protein